MNRWLARLFILVAALFLWPLTCPAPLVYRADEGWTYEPVGSDTGRWRADRAKDQLAVANEAYEKEDFNTALKAARRVVKVWPLSDYAPEAQYLVAKSHQAQGKDEKAFKEYRRVLEKYPTIPQYDEILEQQFLIANKYLAGKWFKLFGYIPFFPNMEKTAAMYQTIIDKGPFSDVATRAQLNIGTAREKQKDYTLAVKAYETAADRYHDRTPVASEAIYKAGIAYNRQAQTAEYDQNVAEQAIATLADFKALFPDDERGAEADEIIDALKTEQARGSFEIARWYEKKKKYDGALIYYNDAILKAPNSSHAKAAQSRIDQIQARRSAP